jgi:hypothetical protein
MPLYFLIPLAIGLATAHLSQQAAADLAEFLGVASGTSLLLSLVLAPWQLLLLMMMVLLSARMFSH